jgi:hypothetical protein
MGLRSYLVIAALLALAPQSAWAQATAFEGAWLEEGAGVCADVFAAAGKALSFKRPASAFASAFIIRNRRLSTPMAACRIDRISPQGPRQILSLSCTTSIATDSARAAFALADDGGLYRFSAGEAGTATKYRRCTPEALKTP